MKDTKSIKTLRNLALVLTLIFVAQSFAKISTPIEASVKANTFSSADFNQIIKDNQEEQESVVRKFQQEAGLKPELKTVKGRLVLNDEGYQEIAVPTKDLNFKTGKFSKVKSTADDERISEELNDSL
jgi:hypothetical protein